MVVKDQVGPGLTVNGQSGGSGYQDLGPKSHAGHDREVYRDCHRLIRAGLENHR
jgi:hypothetical protein